MKKLITIILILSLIPLTVAHAIDRSRIVGYWYTFIDGDYNPEMMINFNDCDYVLSAYFFSKDGYVMLLENDIKDNKAIPTFTSCGKWEAKKNSYSKFSAQILGLGDCEISVEEGGNMYITVPSQNNLKIHLRMIFPFSPYTDYSF